MKKALIILLALVMLLFACTTSFAENATTSNAVELAVVGEDEIDFDKTYGDSQTVYGVYDPPTTSWKINPAFKGSEDQTTAPEYPPEDSLCLIGLCSKNSVNATSVTKSEISRFRSRRPLPPDPYCSAPTQPPPLAAAWPWQVIGKNAKLNRRRDTFVSEISEFRHRRRD